MAEQPDDLGEVIYEFMPMGRYVRVAAVDPATLTEVSIVGDPAVGETLLKRQARRKLAYVLAKKAQT
ncbi:MAG: hypothetical protein MI785_21585 [Kiloniellales bacterium]|nr:hypothetical protein [Kiloniellales bacterium]